uniref:Protein-tyrosine-phosphatase n=1 Tax=Parastrongyloides trichosuri TaxID=131310 RepID=A0A0N4ZIG8_PARTI
MFHQKNLPTEKYVYLPISPATYCTLPRAKLRNDFNNYSSQLNNKNSNLIPSKPTTCLRRNYVINSEYTPRQGRSIVNDNNNKKKEYGPKHMIRNISLINSIYFPSSESVAPSPSNTLNRKITNSKNHYSPVRSQQVGNNSNMALTKHQLYDDKKMTLRQDSNQPFNNKSSTDGSMRRISQPRETTFGITNNEDEGITYNNGNTWSTSQQHKENYDSGISNGSNSYGYYPHTINTGNDASLPSTLNNSTTSSSSSRSPIHNNPPINTKNSQNNSMTMQNNNSTGNNYNRKPNASSNSSSTTSSTSSAYGTAGSYSSNNSHHNNTIYNNPSNSSNHTLTRNSNNTPRITNPSTNSSNGSPYKNSPRIPQQSGVVLNQMNGYSPRSSVASYSSYTSSNGLPSTNNQPFAGTSNNNHISNGTLTNTTTSTKGGQKCLASSSPVRQVSSLSQRRSPNSGIKPINCTLANSYFATPEENLVAIRMRPDVQGKFGFNVKGGADQDHPVIVSKVASGSSADKCYPRLNEGDQVIMINGEDVTHWTHDQVVRFIRSAKDTPTGELILNIKPNVYRYGEHEEPVCINVPEIKHVADNIPKKDMLKQSLRIMQDTLRNGICIEQFESLYRKNPEMTMFDSKSPGNIVKNRYRDILPYDETRVRLQKCLSGDYINASHVNIEIPSSGIVNRYIACQGPLPTTCEDFWEMVWEQCCSTIVMLTTTVENGRVKCHQYWPRLYDSQDYGKLVVTCIKERETQHCAYREISIKDMHTKEERRVSQMQYTSWPDHGVPEDSKHFLDFVEEVRKTRHGSVDPMVVHCSAGIGRTGVLILMETAACKIEANEPIYPIEIVRKMRDQRAMLIQTTEQYVFVCDSILKAYDQGILKPTSEFHKSSR